MNIITVYFENEEAPEDFERVLKVYKYSAKKAIPNANLIIEKIDKPEYYEHHTNNKGGCYKYSNKWGIDNMHKLNKWVDILLNVTENTVITDSDMFFVKDFSEVFDEDFDVAYTERTIKKIRFF